MSARSSVPDVDANRRDWTPTAEQLEVQRHHAEQAARGELDLTPHALQVLREQEAGIVHARETNDAGAEFGFREHMLTELMTHRRALINAGCVLNGQPLLEPR